MGCKKSKAQPPGTTEEKLQETPGIEETEPTEKDHGNAGFRGNQWRRPSFGWLSPAQEVTVEPPNPRDPPFMQTVAPSGTTWGQYVRTSSSFVNPKTGFLSGPWAECIAWAVIFEHTNNWEGMPQYPREGVVGGVITALEEMLKSKPHINRVVALEAAEKLEDASHELVASGTAMPPIQQVLVVPKGGTPGQSARCENPQSPGTFITVKVPVRVQPEQPVLARVPAQPNKGGRLNTGKVAFFVGSSVATGAKASLSHGVNPDARPDEASGQAGVNLGEFDAEVPETNDFLSDLF
mmetsp:Transcript_59340/g.133679  ORF Transcript_59340/g.133679 Transcript_59340/m.133679 type:complete len:294 (+) Transcript_59340:97-978(+)|eukprot:CAMPEP_0197882554 /NCGR_PEP_ID=MMETSP1439-20131203/9661_1 /TAXON_ID=66791 /ORGANISM="Gonyaulax spinifera, Strain CCMP409" /LENGTH=293 /DNA_ID=CAMNT_0043502217 /DNA_START=81 /DNA_END=962 /DNA_ORIENTATION=+